MNTHAAPPAIDMCPECGGSGLILATSKFGGGEEPIPCTECGGDGLRTNIPKEKVDA